MTKNLLSHSGQVFYQSHFYSAAEADQLFAKLKNDVQWQESEIILFGKKHREPRLSAWYGDPDASYRYSGRQMKPSSWTPSLVQIKTDLETHLHTTFNSVLLNLYRSGNDKMGWHRDNEPELGPEPLIASLSLGAERDFDLRLKTDRSQKVRVLLEHGSLLVMSGVTQTHWEHSLPSRLRCLSPRINLTFRRIF